MTGVVPYFIERDGVWQYQRRVPLRVRRDPRWFEDCFGGRPLFRRSFRTKCQHEALTLYPQVDREFEALIAAPAVGPVDAVRAGPASIRRVVTDEDLIAIAERYAEVTAAPFERLHRRANVSSAAAAELQRMESELELDGEMICDAIRSRSDDDSAPTLQPVQEAALVIAEHGYDAPRGSDVRGAVVAAVRSGLEQGYRRIAALSQGDAAPKLGGALRPLKPAVTMTLSDAVQAFLAARALPVKAVSETNLALRQFEQAIGRKSLAAVTRDDVHRFVEQLANHKVGGKTPGSVVRHLSEHSIRKRLRLLSAAVKHVRDRGLFEGENVLNGVQTSAYVKAADKAVMPDKRRLQISELNAIFAHPWFTGCRSDAERHLPGNHRLTGAEFWVPIVALFTGCRAAELGGLKLDEVRLDDMHPHLIIRDNEYRRTKSKRKRCVPIVDALIAMGFPTYVERTKQSGSQRLFPDWTARKRKGAGEADYPAWSNSRIIRSFNRSVIPDALGDKLRADARREVTFHSLRGAFKAMLSVGNAVPTIIVDEVVGHAHSELDGRYVGEVTIEETYPAIHRCGYKGLILPAPPN